MQTEDNFILAKKIELLMDDYDSRIDSKKTIVLDFPDYGLLNLNNVQTDIEDIVVFTGDIDGKVTVIAQHPTQLNFRLTYLDT